MSTSQERLLVTVGLLGPVRLTVDGQAVAVTSSRARHLLAFLAVNANTSVSVDRLVDVVWPDEPMESAVSALRTNIWRLRNLLGEGAEHLLITRPGAYELDLADDAVDIERFERLAASAVALMSSGQPIEALPQLDQALALWRGDALSDVGDAHWITALATRMETLRNSVAERRAEALLGTNRADEALAALHALTAQDPLRERTRALTMRALYQLQRQSEALRCYSDYRSLLAEEMGIEPSPDLRRLEQAILRHDLSEISAVQPTRFSRGYRLEGATASTAISVTYRAIPPWSSEPVTLTTIDRSVACEPGYARVFEIEAQRLRAVQHPNLVPVLDCWRDGDGAYFVTPADTLDGFVADWHADDVAGFADVARQVLGAVGQLHRAGIAHGHLNRGSVLVGSDHRVLILPGAIAAGAQRASDISDRRDLADWLRAVAPARLPEAAAEILADRETGAVEDFAAALLTTLEQGDAALATIANPYVGLRAFQEADSALFFGRDATVKTILERLGDPGGRGRFVAVVGPSGSGKSSAVRAGLLPALRAGALAGSIDWFIAVMTPGTDPLAAYHQALAAVALSPFDDQAAHGDEVLWRAAAAALPAGSTLLVVVDQFEELYTAVDETTREQFIAALVESARQNIDRAGAPPVTVRVVATLRADFYDRPLQHPSLGRLVEQGAVTVAMPEESEIAEAISGPAEVVGLSFQPGLVSTIVRDYRANPVLPLMQHALAELVDRSDGPLLTLATYEQAGGIAGGLAQRAELALQSCGAAHRGVARHLFGQLIHLGDGAADTRRRMLRTDLEASSDAAAAAAGVLECFGDARLLTFDHERQTRQPTVEIAHDSLLSAWGRLGAWIEEDRDGLRLDRQLTEAARTWDNEGRDVAGLLRGARLEAALIHRAERTRFLGPLETAFLDASVAVRQREFDEAQRALAARDRQHHRLRRTSIAAAVLTVAAVLAGAVAVNQARHADRQRADAETASGQARASEELATDALGDAETARQQADTDRRQAEADRLVAQATADATETPARALLLAAAAYDVDPSAASAGALQSAIVARPPGFVGFLPSDTTAQVVAGTTVIVHHSDDAVKIIERSTGAVVHTIADPTTNTRVALSADDAYLALAGPIVRVFDVTGAEVEVVAELKGPANAIDVVFDPTDPTRVAIGFADGTAEIVDWTSGVTQTRIAAQGDGVHDVALSPDGRLLATATGPLESGLRVWDSTTGTAVTPNLGTVGTSLFHVNVIFDASGTRLASVDRGGVGRVWSLPDGTPISRTALDYGFETLHSIAFLNDEVIAASGPSGVLQRWAADDGTDLGAVEPHAGLVTSIAVDPGRTLLVVGGNRHLALFDLAMAGPGHSIEAFPDEIADDLPAAGPVSSSLSADTAVVAVIGRSATWIWDRERQSVRHIDSPGPTSLTLSATLSADASVLVLPYFDLVTRAVDIVVFDVATLSATRRVTALRGTIVALSPDNRWLAYAGISYPTAPTLHVVDLTTGRSRSLIDDLEALTTDVDPIRGSWVSGLTFSSDSTRLAAGNHRGVAMVWDTETWRAVTPIRAPDGGDILDLRYAPSGHDLVLATSANMISLVEGNTNEPVGVSFESSSGLVLGLALSPDRSKLLSGGSDGIQLSDVTAGVPLGRPYPPASAFQPAMRWVDEGEQFAVVTRNGLEFRSADPAQWRADACTMAGRKLTDAERQRFGVSSEVGC